MENPSGQQINQSRMVLYSTPDWYPSSIARRNTRKLRFFWDRKWLVFCKHEFFTAAYRGKKDLKIYTRGAEFCWTEWYAKRAICGSETYRKTSEKKKLSSTSRGKVWGFWRAPNIAPSFLVILEGSFPSCRKCAYYNYALSSRVNRSLKELPYHRESWFIFNNFLFVFRRGMRNMLLCYEITCGLWRSSLEIEL